MIKDKKTKNKLLELDYIYKAYDYDYSDENDCFSYGVLIDNTCQVRRWYGCREEFDGGLGTIKTPKATMIAVASSKSLGIKNIPLFIAGIEEKLHVSAAECCRFQVAKNDKHVLFIHIGPWWLRDSARWQIFTIFLRAGLRYRDQKKNFENALYSEDLIRDTSLAVQYFLNGYTRCRHSLRNSYEGWGDYFYDEDLSYWAITDRLNKLYKLVPPPLN